MSNVLLTLAQAGSGSDSDPARLLSQIIDSVEAGIALYDEHGELVITNQRYRALYPVLGPILCHGTPHHEIVAYGLEHGQFDREHGERGWIERAMQPSASHAPAHERVLADGRRVRVITTSTPLGGWVETHHTAPSANIDQSFHGDVIEAAQLATWDLDVASDVMRVNQRWADMLGCELADLPDPYLSAHWRERVCAEDLVEVDECFYRDIGQGADLIETEYRLRRFDGTWIWVRDRSRILVRDAGGNPLYMAGVIIDISQSKAREEALAATTAELETALAERRAAEGRLAEVAAEAGAWFWTQDADLRLVSTSIGGEHGAARAELALERTFTEWLAENDSIRSSADWRIVLDAQARREPFRDFTYCRIDGATGHETWTRISGAPTYDRDGQFSGYSGVGIDITELHLARRRAEEASSAKSDFLATMSHEIRTPLNGVLGMAEVLERLLVDDAKRGMAATIRQSGLILLDILNNILDLSKIEAGKIELEHLSFDITEVAGDTIGLYSPAAAEKGLTLDLMTASDLQARRTGDPTRIRQILNNIVSNAVKFTDEGEVLVRISGRADRPLVIEVRDTGIGMTEEQLARVGQAFSQADTSIARRYGGTGLGTPIVRKLVELMGGEVRITSAPGVGTTVRATLPLEPGSDTLAERAADDEDTVPNLDGIRVLAVDDNETNLLVLELILNGCGAAVTTARDGAEALTAYGSGHFDVVLLDIAMPVMDGIEALARMRAQDAARGKPRRPILAVTANAMPHQVADYLAQGFDACIAKPISAADLCHALDMLVGPGAGPGSMLLEA